ncbi:hypothetical protein LTR50_004010 [Elasticomyces elasticus]|nr:hypothetical protein LTR50_004010 [Elasticomyces elasticus]
MSWDPAGYAPYPPRYDGGYDQRPYPPSQVYPPPQHYQHPLHGHASYEQPPYPAGYPPAPSGPPPSSYPPPAKRAKGNPTITRYPPPPGYGGPPQPLAAYPPNVYPPPAQGYPTHYPPPQDYSPQNYPPPTSYGQYPPPQDHPLELSYDFQGYEQPPYGYERSREYPPSEGRPGRGKHRPFRNLTWQPNKPTSSTKSSETNGTPTQQSVKIGMLGQAPSLASHKLAPGEEDPFELDFESEAPYAHNPEEIVSELSLGLIIWHPAEPVHRAVPSTYQEANLEAMAPAVPKKGEEGCVSRFFTPQNEHESLLNVRQTDYWQVIKDDLIFVEFPARSTLIPLYQVIASRKRPDLNVEGAKTDDHTGDVTGEAMDVDCTGSDYGAHEGSATPVQTERSSHNVLDSLEQALFPEDHVDGAKPESLSRAGTLTPATRSEKQPSVQRRTSKSSKVKPVLNDKNPNQEDILASLGVTGSPKFVYSTPGPALGAPPPFIDSNATPGPMLSMSPERRLLATSYATGPPLTNRYSHNGGSQVYQDQQHRYHTGYSTHQPLMHQFHAQNPYPPPPPPVSEQQRSPSYDPWKADELLQQNGYDGGGNSPKSVASQHTAVGSDFHHEHLDVTPKAPLVRTESSKKRAHDDGEDAAHEARTWQSDDVSSRTRRKQPRVAEAYR